MGLYLCVFAGDEELDGVEVGSYADFGALRETIRARLEGGEAGSRFPLLMTHSDCDGEWTSVEAAQLRVELETISLELSRLPPVEIGEGWKRSVARVLGLQPANLRDCFFEVNGEPLFDRLVRLCKHSVEAQAPILFQ
jgi:hypothetical protein